MQTVPQRLSTGQVSLIPHTTIPQQASQSKVYKNGLSQQIGRGMKSRVIPASSRQPLEVFSCAESLNWPFEFPNTIEQRPRIAEIPAARNEKEELPTPNLKKLKEILRPYLLTEDTRVVEQNREQAFKEVLLRLSHSRRNKILSYYHVPFAVEYSAGKYFVCTPDFFIPGLRWQSPSSNALLGVILEPHDNPKGKYALRSINRMEVFHKMTTSTIFYVIAGSKSQETLEAENPRFRLENVASAFWKVPNGDTKFKKVKRIVKKEIKNLMHSDNCEIINDDEYADETLANCFSMVRKGIEIMN
jgi:hypothetical protein